MDIRVAELHRALADAIRRSRPDALDRPVTVAEIYQDLVPYRAARAEIGFEMNADYEHALLRLLAGEGDLARIEPREVRDKLRLELDSPNPDVGLYRSYAACDVWVSLADAPAREDDATPFDEIGSSWEEEFVGPTGARATTDPPAAAAVPEALPDVAGDDADDAGDEAEPAPRTTFEIAADAPAPAPGAVRDEGAATPACGFCGAGLPDDRMVNFCPYCGSDQSQQPCPSCGELLDPLWRFCVACGTRVRPLGDHVN